MEICRFDNVTMKSSVEPLQCPTLHPNTKKVKFTPLTKSAVERKYKRPTAILLLNIFVFIIEIIISNNHNIIIIITK